MPNVIEQAEAKIAGKLGGIQAAFHGLTGVFRKLSEEHTEVAVLIKRAATATDATKRADLWATLRVELVAHERAEINHVYPTAAIHAGVEHLVDHLDEQHEAEADALEAVISELDRLDVDSPEWPTTMERLHQLVLRHAKREETTYFPRLQDAIGDAGARDLEEVYLRAKMAIIHDFD